MKCSVIMSVYYEPFEYIKQAIESILQQTETDFEYIIVNDAPQREQLADLLTTYARNDSRIQIVTNEKNSGLVASLNRALTYCCGEYIFRMDADDVALPTRFQEQIAFMEQYDLDMSATLVTIIDENGTVLRTMRPLKRPLISPMVNRLLRFRNLLSHPTWCVKKTVYDHLQGYRLLVPAEDYDFVLRAAQARFKIGLLNRALLNYRHNQNSISHQQATRQYLYAYSMQKYYCKNKAYTPADVERDVAQYQTQDYFSSAEIERYATLKRNNLKQKGGILQLLRCLVQKSIAREWLWHDVQVFFIKTFRL